MEKPQYFSITGIPPFYLDFVTEYPVLAVNIRYTHASSTFSRSKLKSSKNDSLLPGEFAFYLKEPFFLTTDTSRNFKWISLSESSFYVSGLPKSYAEHNRHLSWYGIAKNLGECKNMINPVRQFSITGIAMEGFDPEKEYPVLAIDMDQYIPEDQEKDEAEPQELSQSQTIAFFLVGDDNGEFAWIAEDECRLFPLST
jgi:hypothetical protein